MHTDKNDFYQFKKGCSQSGFYASTDYPFIIGKLVKIKDAEAAADFKVKPVDYIIAQVEGLQVFFVHAGFYKKSDEKPNEETVKKSMQHLCAWYLQHVAKGNKSLFKNFKIQS
jgi:hypothetical protein